MDLETFKLNLLNIYSSSISKINACYSSDEVTQNLSKSISKTGRLTGLLRTLGELPANDRKKAGVLINETMKEIVQAHKRREAQLVSLMRAFVDSIPPKKEPAYRSHRLHGDRSTCPKCGFPHMLKCTYNEYEPCPDCGWLNTDLKAINELYQSVMDQVYNMPDGESANINVGVLKLLLNRVR